MLDDVIGQANQHIIRPLHTPILPVFNCTNLYKQLWMFANIT